jgi:hypothetical protein
MHAVMNCAIALALVVPTLLACSSAAQPGAPVACDWFPGPHAPRSEARTADAGQPPTVSVTAASVERGDTCDLATLALQFRLSDQQQMPGDFSYALRVTSGKLPRGFSLPTSPVPAYDCCGGSCLSLAWTDDPVPHGSFSFSVTVETLDADGRRSQESEPVDIANAGASDPNIGCVGPDQ